MNVEAGHIPQPARIRSLSWWRGSPVGPGMEVRDAEGAYVGEVASVSLGADGEIDSLEVDIPAALAGRRRRKRLAADRIAIKGQSVRAGLYRREIVGLPDA